MTTASMASMRKKCRFDDDNDQQGPSSTLPSPPKRQKVGDDGYDVDDNDDRDGDGDADSNDNDDDYNDDDNDDNDELFPLDSKDKKLFEWRARSDDNDTSSESLVSVGYHTLDDSDDGGGGSSNNDNDDDAAGEFSDEEDW
jgi:hypothetical protein